MYHRTEKYKRRRSGIIPNTIWNRVKLIITRTVNIYLYKVYNVKEKKIRGSI